MSTTTTTTQTLALVLKLRPEYQEMVQAMLATVVDGLAARGIVAAADGPYVIDTPPAVAALDRLYYEASGGDPDELDPVIILEDVRAACCPAMPIRHN